MAGSPPGPPRGRGRPRNAPPPVQAPPDLVELVRLDRQKQAARDAKLRRRFGDAEFDAALRELGLPVPRAAGAPRPGRPPKEAVDPVALYWIAWVLHVQAGHPEYSVRPLPFEKILGIVADMLQVPASDRQKAIRRWRWKYRYEGQGEPLERERWDRLYDAAIKATRKFFDKYYQK